MLNWHVCIQCIYSYSYKIIIFPLSTLTIPAAVVLYYTMWQTALWWFFHISAMFCEIKFPLRAHSFKASGRMKYVHIGLVIAGILIPVIPVTVIASVAGFVPGPFPPILCYSASTNAIFYGIVFPLCVLVATGISLLVCIVWLIIKVQHFLYEYTIL